jgi:7,8-dihydropterin-6-yl-methyl-4-(beta-D-ribofuranosyl)aminobenzene 5'-phosphate synthase
MIIKTLVENTCHFPDLTPEHGLSLYVETLQKKLLFDVGSGDQFQKNAKIMGVDLQEVDFVVISHGHYDHGGGLRTFLNHNTHANIYIRQCAFGNYYTNDSNGDERYIGLDKTLMESPQMVMTPRRLEIEPGFELFSGVRGSDYNPSANRQLLMDSEGALTPDAFEHEQNLIVAEGEKTFLFAGCAHRGIANIMEQFYRLKKHYPTHVIGGFHLYSQSKSKDEDPKKVAELGKYLKEKPTQYYTCHCTGIAPYQQLKEQLGDQIDYLPTGSHITL